MNTQLVITIITILSSLTTVIWFFRDMRRENAKLLKEIAGISRAIARDQRRGFRALARIEKEALEALERIARIEKEGFETLAKILSKIEEKV